MLWLCASRSRRSVRPAWGEIRPDMRPREVNILPRPLISLWRDLDANQIRMQRLNFISQIGERVVTFSLEMQIVRCPQQNHLWVRRGCGRPGLCGLREKTRAKQQA